MQIDTIRSLSAELHPPEALRRQANLADFDAERTRSLAEPEQFWAEEARRFRWTTPFEQVVEWNAPDHKWFLGGRLNIVDNAVDRHADGPLRNKVALIWTSESGAEKKLTYGELKDRVARLATGLRGLGVKQGDRVIIYMPLTLEGVISMLAVARLGAIHSVVYAGLGEGALRERILDAGARVIIAGDLGYRRGKKVDLRSIVEGATRGLELDRIVWFQRAAKAELSARETDFDELLWGSKPEVAPVPVESEHPLFILYTSGSTGKPKGVVHVHGGYMVGIAYHLRTFFDVKPTDVVWTTSDIGWIVGHSYIVYAPLCEGATLLFREGAPDFPDAGAVFQTVERHGVNVMFTAPTTLRMFMKLGDQWPRKYDLSSLRLLAVAGEPLNPEAWRWAHEVIMRGGKDGFVVDNWWQTELGGPTIGTPLNRPGRPGKAGVALPGVDACVVDANGDEVAPDQGGLLAIRRPFPHMMRTVWGNHDRYRAYWSEFNKPLYAAGDLAVRDADGYFAILGRSDDVMNVAGHRIGSAEVESAINAHPAVAESAVVGVPDALKGEGIQAHVVLKAGHEKSEALIQAIIATVRRELGPIATPNEVRLVDKLPKTRSGKIVRRLLRAQAQGRDAGDLSTLEE